jgi:hypothetical protein
MAWNPSPEAFRRLEKLQSSYRISHSQEHVIVEFVDRATDTAYGKFRYAAGTSESAALDKACEEVQDHQRPQSVGQILSEKDARILELEAKLEKLSKGIQAEPEKAKAEIGGKKKPRTINIDGKPLNELADED